MHNYKPYIIAISILIALTTFFYLSSAVYFVMAGFDFQSIKPWSIFEIMTYSNDPLMTSRLWIAFGAPILAGFALRHFFKDAFLAQRPVLGDAKWANFSTIKKTRLFKESGLILGKYNDKYLINDDPTHIMLVAPTRSGKGVGLVVPNLLTWQGSVVCLDMKHENYKKTAGFRDANGQAVYMWSPMDGDHRSHKYNPLDMISDDPFQRITDIQVIANILVQNPPNSDDHWAEEGRALFLGLALYLIDSKDSPVTIGAIKRLLGTESDLGDVCRHIIKTHPEFPSAAKTTLLSFANKASKERSGVKSALDKALNLWKNPIIDAATSSSDFYLSDLRKKKMSIYVGVTTGQIETLSPLLRIFFEQVITTLSMKEPNEETEPHKVLILLDEFHMLGKMDVMGKAFTLLGSYNVRLMAVVQSLNWLDSVYNKTIRNGILSCCAHQIFFSANDLETAGYVSESCGMKTIDVTTCSQRKSLKYEPATKTVSQRAHPLITKHEVRELSPKDEIILVEASKPIKASKIKYFEDKDFKDRHEEAPKVPPLNITESNVIEFKINKPPAEECLEQDDLFDSPPQDLGDSIDIKPDDDQKDDFLGSLGDNLK